MKKKVIVKGEDWVSSIYSTKEWHNSVEVIRYEHDYEKNTYTIEYNEINAGMV